METAGYSKTPLAKKLGIKEGSSVIVMNQPKEYINFFHDFPERVVFVDSKDVTEVDFVHLFVSTYDKLDQMLPKAKEHLKTDGILWISWPKKSSNLPSEIGKFDVLKSGLDIGLVDVKVAAIDHDWSGHKFVYRKTDR